MEGFKANPKMKSDIACYKEGGSVYKSRTHKEDPAEVAEDKAMVKKGIRQHETAKHKGEEKTEIKLKQGGRSKKDTGTVRKYKTGGVCNPMKDGGAIAMKKGKEDKKEIAQTKKTKPGKAATPSAAVGKKKESPKTSNKPAGKTMTASMVGALPEAPEAPSAAMGMPEDQPIEMMADGGTPSRYNYGEVNGIPVTQEQMMEAERRMPELTDFANQARARMQKRRPMPGNAGMGPIGQAALAGAQGAGLGAAAAPGPMGAAAAPGAMGAAAPMGATQDIMRGLQTLGQYAGGGEVY